MRLRMAMLRAVHQRCDRYVTVREKGTLASRRGKKSLRMVIRATAATVKLRRERQRGRDV